MDNKILDTIIFLIEASKPEKDVYVFIDEKQKRYGLNNCRYLLGQVIRNYHIPLNHYYISQAAINRWNELSDEPIFHYWYTKIVKIKNGPKTISKYVGNSNKPKAAENAFEFKFREIFHDEHIVTVNNIIDELVKLKEPNYDNVTEILDKIYICRILKDEDRKINHKSNRSIDFEKVRNNEYKGIKLVEVKDWNQIFETKEIEE